MNVNQSSMDEFIPSCSILKTKRTKIRRTNSRMNPTKRLSRLITMEVIDSNTTAERDKQLSTFMVRYHRRNFN